MFVASRHARVAGGDPSRKRMDRLVDAARVEVEANAFDDERVQLFLFFDRKDQTAHGEARLSSAFRRLGDEWRQRQTQGLEDPLDLRAGRAGLVLIEQCVVQLASFGCSEILGLAEVQVDDSSQPGFEGRKVVVVTSRLPGLECPRTGLLHLADEFGGKLARTIVVASDLS